MSRLGVQSVEVSVQLDARGLQEAAEHIEVGAAQDELGGLALAERGAMLHLVADATLDLATPFSPLHLLPTDVARRSTQALENSGV